MASQLVAHHFSFGPPISDCLADCNLVPLAGARARPSLRERSHPVYSLLCEILPCCKPCGYRLNASHSCTRRKKPAAPVGFFLLLLQLFWPSQLYAGYQHTVLVRWPVAANGLFNGMNNVTLLLLQCCVCMCVCVRACNAYTRACRGSSACPCTLFEHLFVPISFQFRSPSIHISFDSVTMTTLMSLCGCSVIVSYCD